MNQPFTLPSIEALTDLHDELLAEHGGAPGLRDRGALEAALARPLQVLAYAEQPLQMTDLAAAICFALCRSHPFVDGNKRAAFAALGITLELNGFTLDVTEREATDVIQTLASGQMTEDALRTWVARNSFEE